MTCTWSGTRRTARFPAGTPISPPWPGGRPGHREIRRRAVGAGSYAVHWRWNTGVRDLAGPPYNPHPGALAGFRCRQGLDSPGGDLGCAGRDAPRLIELALPRPEVVGFNTDVYLKWRLRPRG